MEYNIGDRVICTKKYSKIKVGMIGTYVHYSHNGNPDNGISWDELTSGHNCSGRINDNSGYYLPYENIAKYAATEEDKFWNEVRKRNYDYEL